VPLKIPNTIIYKIYSFWLCAGYSHGIRNRFHILMVTDENTIVTDSTHLWWYTGIVTIVTTAGRMYRLDTRLTKCVSKEFAGNVVPSSSVLSQAVVLDGVMGIDVWNLVAGRTHHIFGLGTGLNPDPYLVKNNFKNIFLI